MKLKLGILQSISWAFGLHSLLVVVMGGTMFSIAFAAVDKLLAAVGANSAGASQQVMLLALSGLGLVLILAANIAFFLYLRASLLEPLAALRAALDGMKKNQDVKIKADDFDFIEMQEIGDAFNEMVYSIRAHDVILQHQHETMIRSSKMASLGEMSAGVAHEINNPLAIISGNLQQLQRRLEGSPEPDLMSLKNVERASTSVERIAKIVSGLRAFARDSEKDLKRNVSIASVLENTLGLCTERYSKFGISLEVTDFPDQMIFARASQVEQVLLNLLNNAIDAVMDMPPEKHWVRLEVTSDEAKVQIKVTDGGEGIPNDVAAKMMEPFFTTKEVGKGTGLGLSISLGIVSEHGGALFLDRRSNNTCFILELPIAVPKKLAA